ncbi:MAG: hypothetical protein FWD64_06815 [Acidobacteriaceae bacterium]|nr:hypothetical protein [Acidobacteriaceae bacterium]
MFSEKAGVATFFYFTGKLAHGLPCNGPAFPEYNRSAGFLKRGEEFGALALAVFPQSKCFPYGFHFRM